MQYAPSPRRQYPVWLLTLTLAANAADAISAAQPADLTSALHAVLAKNISHARQWLEAGDFKSLAQAGNGLQLYTEMLRARSDDAAWQAAMGKILTAVGQVRAAANMNDAAKGQAALEALEKAATAAAATAPIGQPKEMARAPGIRPLMLAMEGVAADAKIALLTGNVPAAKSNAHVLSELSRLVSNSRTDEPWTRLVDDFTKACLAAATSTTTDREDVRQEFRGVMQRCDACHEAARPKAP